MDRTTTTVAEAPAPVEPATDPKPARKATARKRATARPAADQVPDTSATPAAPAGGETNATVTPAPAPAADVPPATVADDTAPAADDTPATPEPAASADVSDVGWTEAQHEILDAMGVYPHRGARGLLWREARRTGLDPMAGHLYLRQDFVFQTVQNGVGNWIERKTAVYSVGTKIAGFRTVARNNRAEYRGQTPPQWTGDGKTWWDVWVANEPPAACRVGVLLEGQRHAVMGIAVYREFKPATTSAKSSWVKMPSHMNWIAAEAMALRRAFPDLLSDIYTDEEMAQARASMENALITGAPVTGFEFGEATERPTENPGGNPGGNPAGDQTARAERAADDRRPDSPARDGLMAAVRAAEALAYLREHPGRFDDVYATAGRSGLLYVNLADEQGATLKDAMAAFWIAHVADMAEFQPGMIPDIRATAKRRRLLNSAVPGDDGVTLRDLLDRLERGYQAPAEPPAPAEPDDAGDPPPAEPYDDGEDQGAADYDWHVPGNQDTRPRPDAPAEPVTCSQCPEEIDPRTPATYIEGKRVCQSCAAESIAAAPAPF